MEIHSGLTDCLRKFRQCGGKKQLIPKIVTGALILLFFTTSEVNAGSSEYTYDDNGRLIYQIISGNAYVFTYDKNGNLKDKSLIKDNIQAPAYRGQK